MLYRRSLCRSIGFYRKPCAGIQRSFFSSVSGREEEEALYGSGWDAGPRAVKVSVWWDFENCDIPVGVPATKVSNNIVCALRMRGFKGPVSITAYGDTWLLSRSTQEALACTGISLHHLPSSRKNAFSDRTLMVDLVLWTMDHPPPAHLFIISTDADLSSALHALRMKNYNVLLACNSQTASPALLAAATSVWQWGKLARGEGLIAQTTVTCEEGKGCREFLQDNPPTEKPPPESPSPLSASVTTKTTSTTWKSPVSCQSTPCSSDAASLREIWAETPAKPVEATRDDPLDNFHKDVCKLLQQAASSMDSRKAKESVRSIESLSKTTPEENLAVIATVSIEQEGIQQVSEENKVVSTQTETGTLIGSEAPYEPETEAEDRKKAGSTQDMEDIKSVTAAESTSDIQEQPESVIVDEANLPAAEPATEPSDLENNTKNEIIETEAPGGETWTWAKFFFGRSTQQDSSRNHGVDTTDSTAAATEEQNIEGASELSASSEPEAEVKPPSRLPKQRSWLSRLWNRTDDDKSEDSLDYLRRYIETADGASILWKSQNQKEFTELLRKSGPSWIQELEENTLSHLVSRLVNDKVIDTTPWQLKETWRQSGPDNMKDTPAEPDIERPEAAEDSKSSTVDESLWESRKQHHYPNLEELRIWLIYMLEIQQEKKNFDVSQLRWEFRKHFGTQLELNAFGCVKMKELLAIMQDMLHVRYPKPTLCVIRSRLTSRKAKAQPRSLHDYSALLAEMLHEHPEGVPISMIQARFYQKFNIDLDYRKLGFSRLESFLKAANKDIEARVDNDEHSVYVLRVRTDQEQVNENLQRAAS